VRQPWFGVHPADEAFLEGAPLRLSEAFEIAQPAARVWEELTADHPLAWCRILRDVSWTSPRPFGVGTTRTARLVGGAGAIRERFFRWEEGRRKSFCVVEATAPLFRRFAEDYLVEPESDSSCRFEWTIAAEPRPAVRPATPGFRRLLGTLFRDTREHYERR
jgi:Polyketide cyclase / dehydrase and lipid transport